MRRILHLSDLHYGRADPELEAPLLDVIARLSPDLVAISGDFTQRARERQFVQAAAFLSRIGAPVLPVPGNHDTPLDNLALRIFRPFSRYRRHICRALEPAMEDEALSIVGVNTVNRFAWQRGKVSRRTLGRVCAGFEDAGDRLRIVVLHHPLEHGPGVGKRLTKGAGRALRALSACGADVVLSGHLHTAWAAPFAAAPGLLFVQAGTGLSTRLREEANTFNLLEIERARVTITTWRARRAPGDAPAFAPLAPVGFAPGPEGWQRLETEAAAPAPAAAGWR